MCSAKRTDQNNRANHSDPTDCSAFTSSSFKSDYSLPEVPEIIPAPSQRYAPEHTSSPQIPSWDREQAQVSRPVYTARSSRLPARTVADNRAEGTRKLRVQSLQRRMLVHTLTISIAALFILGIVLVVSGIYQVRSVEREQMEMLRSNFSDYLVEQSEAEYASALSAEELLSGFIKTQGPIDNGALVGMVDGRLISTQSFAASYISSDQQLLSALNSWQQEEEAIQLIFPTDRGRYAVGIIPFQIAGGASGILVGITDYNIDLAPTINTLKLYAGISLLVAAILALINSRVSASLLLPLRQIRTMMTSISSQQDLSKRLPVHGNDDLAEVARQTNNMIERLQRAFEKERELLNDVGHELRTPITIMRGHLELLNPEDPQETLKTRELALSELSRMHRLTEDLVTVAKSDRPDFLRIKRVDIGDLLMDSFEHASQLGDFAWRIDQLTMVQTSADPERLQQALLQLCQNATKFATEGSQISLGAAVDYDQALLDQNGEVVETTATLAPQSQFNAHPDLPSDTPHHLWLWVRDHGIGVEAKNQQRIFERFARVNHSLSGSGLGLSIVNAIVQAHHGQLQLRSHPQVGSVFALVLPLTDQDYLEQLKGDTP